MTELQIFNNAEFGSVRTLEIDGKPYFVASDVAKSLGYANPRDAILRHCKGVVKHDGVSKTTNQYGTTTEQTMELNFIPEGDIYRLITHSKLPSAERFETWVFDEVLPSIRKNGGYIAGQEKLSDDELLAKAVMVAQKKIAERDAKIKELESSMQNMDRVINEMKPKANYVDMILKSPSTVLITQIAQDYGMSAKAFNKKLSQLRIQRKVGEQWILYADYLGRGYTHSKTVNIVRSNGMPDVKMQTEWTQKGRLFLYEELKKHGIYPMIEENEK